jgi:signal transduction histidine kinase
MSRVEVSGWRGLAIANTIGGLIVPLIAVWFSPEWNLPEFRRTLLFSMTYSWSVGTTAHFSFILAGLHMCRSSQRTAWSIAFAVLTFSALAGCAAGTTIIVFLSAEAGSWITVFLGSLRFCLPIALGFGVVMGVTEDTRRRLRTTALQLKTRELERERAEKHAMEARLSSLESRVHPHFLFNALNSISSLVRDDPARAERLIERMASLLRHSLDAHRAGLVTLGRELRTVGDYVEIEQARFGRRLRFTVDVPDELLEMEIPSMSIQTLVENSVKYAVSPCRDGASIRVTADANAGTLRVTVSDDGPGFSPEDIPAGHGLDLLQSRLETLFGPAGRLELNRNEVSMRLPARIGVRARTGVRE